MQTIYDYISTYPYEQISYLNTTYLKNFNWSFPNAVKYALVPFAIKNKDTKIPLTSDYNEHRNISEVNIRCGLLNYLINQNSPEKNQINTILIKRGNTLAYQFFKNNGYEELKPISIYLQTGINHKIRAYRKGRQIIIITNMNDTKVGNLLFSTIPLLFNEDYTFDDELIAYFKNFGTDERPAIDYFKEFEKKQAWFKNLRLDQLKKIINQTSSYTYTKYKNQLMEYKARINQLESDLNHILIKYNDTLALINFWQPNINVDEVTDYIAHNPNIVDYYAQDDNKLILAIEAPLEYIDIKAFKKMLSNPNAFIYPKFGTNFPQNLNIHSEKFIQMLHDLFLGTRYKIYSRAEIVLDFLSKKTYPLAKESIYSNNANALHNRPSTWRTTTRCNNTTRSIAPHMHIEFYDCWSGNKTNIEKRLIENDYIGAIDIAINTVKDLNVNDGIVFGRFLEEGLWAPSGPPNDKTTKADYLSNRFKTIYDAETKTFRTFYDIFYNDYVKNEINQIDLNEDFTSILENLA